MNTTEEPKLSEWSEHWSQEPDCCDPNTLGQEIHLRTQDGGGGNFLIIETNRWAIDDIDKFADMLKRFMSRNNTE